MGRADAASRTGVSIHGNALGRGEIALRRAQDHADGDLLGALGQMIAALRAANAAQKATPGQHADDLLHVFPGYILPLGDFAHAHRHFAVVLRHIDHDAQSIPTLG